MSRSRRNSCIARIVISLMLSACAFRPPGDEVHRVFMWRCSTGSAFSVYFDAQGAAVVSAALKKYVLPPARSASGARYADGEVELWEHRGKATLLGADGGPYRDCVRQEKK
jgi:membrane-bound inhibitor of C-type lysozyme